LIVLDRALSASWCAPLRHHIAHTGHTAAHWTPDPGLQRRRRQRVAPARSV